MSDTTNSPQRSPSPSRECREKDGYAACFYPGFVRRLAVVRQGSEIVLYEQEGPFVLPEGEKEPWPASEVEFTGPGEEIRLRIDDPGHRIARIEVVFKQEGVDGGTGEDGGGDGDSLVIWETPLLCPPYC